MQCLKETWFGLKRSENSASPTIYSEARNINNINVRFFEKRKASNFKLVVSTTNIYMAEARKIKSSPNCQAVIYSRGVCVSLCFIGQG